MALVDHEYLYLLKAQRPGTSNFTIFLTNLDDNEFYAAIVAGWLVEKGLIPTTDWSIDKIGQLSPDWQTFSADGQVMGRDEFVQMFCESSVYTYEAILSW